MIQYIIAIAALGGIGGVFAVILVISEHYFANYGECKIDINAGGREYTVTGGSTLLNSLVDNKLFVPSACGGKGTCGYCKCKVLNDIGPVLPTETGMLTRSEIKQNVRLSCQIKVKADMQIEVPEEYFAIQEFRSEVSKIVQVTENIRELTFKLLEPAKMNFRAGKYVQIRFPRDEGIEAMHGKYAGMDFTNFDERLIDPEIIPNDPYINRAYSMSNGPGADDIVELDIRIAPPPPGTDLPPGIGSSWLWNLKEGNEVWLTGPYGDFFIKDTDKPCVFIGGGAGMAPMKSMILELFEVQKTKRDVKFYYGARAKKDLFYDDIFEKIEKENPSFEFITALSEPDPKDKWEGHTGFVHLVVEKTLKEFTGREYYLCGPPLMIKAVTTMLDNHGVPEEDIAYDEF